MGPLVEAEEEDDGAVHLGGGVEGGDVVLLVGEGEGALAGQRGDVGGGKVGEAGGVPGERGQAVHGQDAGEGVGEGGGQEGIVGAQEGHAVQRRPAEVVGHLAAELARQHRVVLGQDREVRHRRAHGPSALLCSVSC